LSWKLNILDFFHIQEQRIERSKSLYPRRYLTQWYAFIRMNDRIREKISSSPISLSTIFVVPTTSAPALVLRTSMHICTFGVFMEQRAVNQKSGRVSYSKLLLRALIQQKASDFRRIVTGDESWFFFDYPRDLAGRRSVMSFLNVPSRKLTRQGAWFRSFGR
jgi:hypothetical protein